MAKKKEVKLYDVQDGKVILEKKNIVNLSAEDNKMIAFYVQTLGFDLVMIEEEPKTRNDFTVAKAMKYIKKNGKKNEDKAFTALADKATKLSEEYKKLKAAIEEAEDKEAAAEAATKKQKEMLKESGNAFRAQKKWFKETYGEEAYEAVRKYK